MRSPIPRIPVCLLIASGLLGGSVSCSRPANDIVLEQVLRFPPPDSDDPDYYLATPNDFELLPDQRVAIVDWMQHVVWIVDEEGELVAQVGRQGQGPGEFSFPDEAAFDESTHLLWVRDRNKLQAFDQENWSYSHGFIRDVIRGVHLQAIHDTLYMATFDEHRPEIIHAFNAQGELLFSFGEHPDREVGPAGRRIHRLGSMHITVGSEGALIGCYTYSVFNDVLLITPTSQSVIHIRDRDVIRADRENRDKARDWPTDDDDRPPPYNITRQSMFLGDRLFVLLTRLVGQRLVEIDTRGYIVHSYSFPTPPEVQYPSPIKFTVGLENGTLVVWMLWNQPYPHIVKLMPRS